MAKESVDLDDFEFADDGYEDDGGDPDEGDEPETEEQEASDEEADDDDGEPEEEQAATPAEKGAEKKQSSQKSVDDDDAPEWARKAVQAERRKRQEERAERLKLEKQIAYLQGRVESIASTKSSEEPDEPEEEIDYSDIPGYVKRVTTKAREKERKALEAEIAKAKREEFDIRAEASEELAREKYEDFDDVIEEFKEIVAKDPALQRKVLHAPDPAEYAYRYMKSRSSKSEVADLKAELAALKKKLASDEPRGNPRQSLARARGAGPTVSRNKGAAKNDSEFFTSVFTR